jgi:hypothetical protein
METLVRVTRESRERLCPSLTSASWSGPRKNEMVLRCMQVREGGCEMLILLGLQAAAR